MFSMYVYFAYSSREWLHGDPKQEWIRVCIATLRGSTGRPDCAVGPRGLPTLLCDMWDNISQLLIFTHHTNPTHFFHSYTRLSCTILCLIASIYGALSVQCCLSNRCTRYSIPPCTAFPCQWCIAMSIGSIPRPLQAGWFRFLWSEAAAVVESALLALGATIWGAVEAWCTTPEAQVTSTLIDTSCNHHDGACNYDGIIQ